MYDQYLCPEEQILHIKRILDLHYTLNNYDFPSVMMNCNEISMERTICTYNNKNFVYLQLVSIREVWRPLSTRSPSRRSVKCCDSECRSTKCLKCSRYQQYSLIFELNFVLLYFHIEI